MVITAPRKTKVQVEWLEAHTHTKSCLDFVLSATVTSSDIPICSIMASGLQVDFVDNTEQMKFRLKTPPKSFLSQSMPLTMADQQLCNQSSSFIFSPTVDMDLA